MCPASNTRTLFILVEKGAPKGGYHTFQIKVLSTDDVATVLKKALEVWKALLKKTYNAELTPAQELNYKLVTPHTHKPLTSLDLVTQKTESLLELRYR